MAEYSRLLKGDFISTGAAQVINLPVQPGRVDMVNVTASATPANHGISSAIWTPEMVLAGVNQTIVQLFNATPVSTTGAVTTGGISTFAAGQLLQYGPSQQIIGITKANPASINVTAHGYQSGDVVILNGLFQTSMTGMPQIAGIPFTVTRVDANNFTIPWNTNQSNYIALSASPAGATVRKVLYPYLYFPGQSFISAITTGATTTVTTTNAHNFVVGQEVAFRIPSQWGTVQLNSLPNTLVPGSPIYGYVISVTDYHTVVVNINSSAFTAFNSNLTVAQTIGLSYPQIVAVGDVNTGGVQISSGSPLYPSPQYIPIGTTPFSTINGPAILGSYVNNTAQGFIIGAGAATSDASSVLVGNVGDLIQWFVTVHDMTIP
jgi:hypothetical protein